jgi:membrane protein required for colicin V production
MNWLDIVLLLVLAISVVTSFRKGFTREVIGLVAVVVALAAGTWFYGMAGAFLLPYVSSPTLAHLAGFFLVFFGVILLGGLVSHLAGRFLRVTGLSIFDHLLGAGFGLLRGVLISVALILGIMAFSRGDGPPVSVVNSRIAPYVAYAARAIAAVAPHELREGFRKRYDQVSSSWGRALEKRAPESPKTEKGENGQRI